MVPTTQRVLEEALSLGAQGLRIAQTRLEILAVDLEREKAALARQLALAVACGTSAALAVFAAILWAALALGPRTRFIVLGALAAVLVVVAILCGVLFRLPLIYERFFDMPMQFDATFVVMIFLAGALTASFYGWLPLYLPELFPTRIRATAQGFSFNFGRVLAAVGALQSGRLVNQFHEDYARMGAIMSLVYLVGLVLIWFCPETKGQPLPE